VINKSVKGKTAKQQYETYFVGVKN